MSTKKELMILAEAIKSAYEQDKNSYLVLVFDDVSRVEQLLEYHIERERLLGFEIKSGRQLFNSLEEGEMNVCIRLRDLLPDKKLVYNNTNYIINRIRTFENHELDGYVKIIVSVGDFMRDNDSDTIKLLRRWL